jgi:glucose/arabinose dehydrogenase
MLIALRRATLAVALLAACRDGPTAPEAVPAQLVLTASLRGTRVAEVVVEVSAPDIQPPLVFNLTVVDSVASGAITVTAGSDRAIMLRCFDAAGVETHRGGDTITVQPSGNPPLQLTLLPLAGDVPIDVTIAGIVVTVSPAADTLVVGGLTRQLTASIMTTGGTPVSGRVQWASLNPALATVDTGGRVRGHAPGSVQVVATYAGAGGAAALQVLAPNQVPPALQQLASGLSMPLFATAPPGDTARLFVVEQTGRIRILRNDTLLPTPFLDLSAAISCCVERGLLGMAFHPQYGANGRFLVNYTDAAGATQVVRYSVSSDPNVADPATAVTVLSQSQPFANHNGGMLAFGPDGYLYIGLGDGGSGGDPQGNGQNPSTWLGKMLRLDVTGATPYAVPPSNPFVGQAGVLPEIWATGLRNPWRYAFDRATGDLYIADVGQNAREEINVQPAGSTGGQNYGWNIMEGTACYSPPTGCSTAGLTLPVHDYSHTDGCSVTGGYVYRGARIPMLTGAYFYGDFCGGWVRSFRWSGGVVSGHLDWVQLRPAGGQVSSFGEDGRGELYVVSLAGSVYRIVPAYR